MILLRMTNSFYGKEDHKLTDRLLTERAGILNWAILGWQRLQERGYFVQPKASEELIETMVDIASPITSFIEDCCEIGGGLQVTVADLFKNWKEWCESKGRKPGTEQSLGRDLSAAAPFVSMRRPSENGKRVRVYEGIRIINSDSSAIF
jgi:putative DNA primase/helicase